MIPVLVAFCLDTDRPHDLVLSPAAESYERDAADAWVAFADAMEQAERALIDAADHLAWNAHVTTIGGAS